MDHRCPVGEEDTWNNMLQRFELFKKNIDIVVEQENAFKITDLKVSGKDIIDLLNIKPGPLVGQILKSLFDAVIDEQVKNERTALLELAKTLA